MTNYPTAKQLILWAGLIVSGAPLQAADTVTADSQARLSLISRMQELQAEIRSMRGVLEENSQQIERLKKRQGDLYLDLDQRLGRLESAATSAVSPTAESVAPSVVPGPASEVPVASQESPEPSVSGDSSLSIQQQQTAYQESFDYLKNGQYPKAIAGFRAFLEQFPDSPYAGNAQYWIGEAYYVTRDFKQALTEFNTVLVQYPDSPKVADAMLKIGYSHYEEYRWDEAEAVLQELQEKWPASAAARLADTRLRKGPKPRGLP